MRLLLIIAFLQLFYPLRTFSSSGNSNVATGDTFSLNENFKREVTVEENDPDDDEIVVTPWTKYENGPSSSLAVLITNPNCDWLALSHGLKTIGIPFIITNNYKTAVEHKMVLIYPELNSVNCELANLLLIREYVLKGGYLVGMNVEGMSVQDIFGYTRTDYVDNATSLTFKKLQYNFEELSFIKEPKVNISDLKLYLKTIKYIEPAVKPLAIYDDGNGAIIENNFGKGKAVAMGFDLGAFISKGYNGRIADLKSPEANQYKPDLDVFLRLIREYYRESGGAVLSTCQHGKHLTVIITHDIDGTNAIANSFGYAKYEKENNLNSTYFVQTKYVKDWDVLGFFTKDNIKLLKELKGLNIEIGSNSVSRAKTFRNFDPGDCEETANNYLPILEAEMVTRDASVSGEILVSKQLLDSTLGNKTASFRPGYFSYPKTLPQALYAGGYTCSSSMTANDALTHYPFQLCRNREDVADLPVFEFPVTIENNGAQKNSLQQTLEIADLLSKQEGLMVLSIDPNTFDDFDLEKKLVKSQGNNAVFSSMNEFGNWWSARNEVSIEVIGNKVMIDSPTLIEGLTILLPNGKSQVLPFFKDHMEVIIEQ